MFLRKTSVGMITLLIAIALAFLAFNSSFSADTSDGAYELVEAPWYDDSVWDDELGEEVFTDANFNYRVKDYATITSYKGSSSEVNVPNTLGDKPVKIIWHEAFKDNTTITLVALRNL